MNESIRWMHHASEASPEEVKSYEASAVDSDAALDAGKLHNQGDTKQALLNLDELIAQDPSYTRAYFIKGAIYADLKNYPEAVQAISEGIAKDPTDPEGYWCLAFIHYNHGDKASAQPHWHSVVNLCKTILRTGVSGYQRKGYESMATTAQRMLEATD